MDIKGSVTMSLSDYEKMKSKLNELDELKSKIHNLFTEEFSHIDKTVITIDESNIVDFIADHLKIDYDPLDVNVENHVIRVEWDNSEIPF